MEELKSINKIGEGQDAEVYAMEDSKVIKLFRNSNYEKTAIREMEILKIIYESGIHIPKVYEYVNISKRPGFIMERVNGNSILSSIEKQPYLMIKMATIFGKLHSEIHRCSFSTNIPLLKGKLEKGILAVDCLEKEIIEYTLRLLGELPNGNSICHGDYNPSNVIISDNSPVLLDWGGVSIGDATADVAHTLLILKNGQFPPNTPDILKFLLMLGRKAFANMYFHAYQQNNPLDLSVLSKWEMVRAVGRLEYGGKEERPALLKFIRRFYNNKDENKIILF